MQDSHIWEIKNITFGEKTNLRPWLSMLKKNEIAAIHGEATAFKLCCM